VGVRRPGVDQIVHAADINAALAQRLNHATILGLSKIDVDATRSKSLFCLLHAAVPVSAELSDARGEGGTLPSPAGHLGR
jgi:hypothetical protein